MTAVFVSYPRTQRAVVDRLVDDLRSGRMDTYFDKELIGGQHWWNELLTRIEQADVFMPVVCADYADSAPCDLELKHAVAWRKPVLPVAVEQVSGSLFPSDIAEAQWVTYDPDDPRTALSLIGALISLPPAPDPPEVPPERPRPPIDYMTGVKNEIAATEVPMTRERQLVVFADLRQRLDTPNRATALTLLRALQNRPDLTYQVGRDVAAVLADVRDQDAARAAASPVARLAALRREITEADTLPRERQRALIAELRPRLASDEHDAAVMLLTALRQRADIGIDTARTIEGLLARPGSGSDTYADTPADPMPVAGPYGSAYGYRYSEEPPAAWRPVVRRTRPVGWLLLGLGALLLLLSLFAMNWVGAQDGSGLRFSAIGSRLSDGSTSAFVVAYFKGVGYALDAIAVLLLVLTASSGRRRIGLTLSAVLLGAAAIVACVAGTGLLISDVTDPSLTITAQVGFYLAMVSVLLMIAAVLLPRRRVW